MGGWIVERVNGGRMDSWGGNSFLMQILQVFF